MTGIEILKLYGSLNGFSGKELQIRMDEAIEKVGANKDWLHRKLRSYSKGMLQRVGLAQAILHRPQLLILDEPMSGLDPMGRREIRQLLQALHAEGTTIFYSSHVLADVESICNKVAMVVSGSIRRSGTVEDVLQDETAVYQITLNQNLAESKEWSELIASEPLKTVTKIDHKIICQNEVQKNKVLPWLIEKGVGIEHLETQRPSLEDVLAEEVSKAHANVPKSLTDI